MKVIDAFTIPPMLLPEGRPEGVFVSLQFLRVGMAMIAFRELEGLRPKRIPPRRTALFGYAF